MWDKLVVLPNFSIGAVYIVIQLIDLVCNYCELGIGGASAAK